VRKLIIVLAVIVVLTFPALAQKGTEVLEGTVVDQDRRPLRGLTVDINRTGYEDYSPSSRFLWRTDKQGHFHVGLPAGTYSVNIASPDGRILKQIPDVRVEAGKVQSLDSAPVGILAPTSPLPRGKKSKGPPPPTQPDIVRGCITVRGITFQRASLWHPVGMDISGSITNDCGKDAYVTIDAAFFDANDTKIGDQQIQKLVSAGSRPEFHLRPDLPDGAVAAGYKAAQYQNGRVMDVFLQFQP
jgi:hypothetical protein